MRSAVKKFQPLHPENTNYSPQFFNLQNPRKSAFSWQTESEQINCEWSNMIRNEELLKFREEDEIFVKQRTNKPQIKRGRWSKNLLDVRTISPQATPPSNYTDKMLGESGKRKNK